MQKADFIWFNGTMMPWEECRIHVMSHGIHYGSTIFEGIRAYQTPKGTAVFRLEKHMDRFIKGCRVYKLHHGYTLRELIDACRQVIGDNKLDSCYLRPIAIKGTGKIAVYAPDNPTDVAIAAFPWGAYLGEEGMAKGIDVCISSWQRVAPNTIPAGVKAGGNYLSSQLITIEAHERGFDEGIGLGPDGLLSEGAGENLFLVRDGKIFTPPGSASILSGITRDTIITLARDLGYEVTEQALTREMLYFADELFFTGTAAEVTPIRSIDGLAVGNGERPVTSAMSQAFFGLFDGSTADKYGWLDYV